jgi:uncharacterized cupredoxin-like copper-binding protein
MLKRQSVFAAAAVATAMALTASMAFAQDAEEATEMEPMAGTVVNVTLQEWAVIPDVLSVPAGSVTFNAENVGPVDPHELVVVRTDIPASDLPTREDGGFDEDAEGVEVIGEIEEFAVGASESATWDLAPGNYALLCNLVELEEGELEAHYQLGMWIDFEVTA